MWHSYFFHFNGRISALLHFKKSCKGSWHSNIILQYGIWQYSTTKFISLSTIRGRCPANLECHFWPHDLADKQAQQQLDVQDSLKTNIRLTCFQRVGRDLGSPQPTSLAGRLWGQIAKGGGGEQIKGYQRNPVSVRQLIVRPWCEAEALLLPADKVAPLRSAEPLHLCT